MINPRIFGSPVAPWNQLLHKPVGADEEAAGAVTRALGLLNTPPADTQPFQGFGSPTEPTPTPSWFQGPNPYAPGQSPTWWTQPFSNEPPLSPIPTAGQIETATSPAPLQGVLDTIGNLLGLASRPFSLALEALDKPRVGVDMGLMAVEQQIAKMLNKPAPFGRWLDPGELAQLATTVGGSYVMSKGIAGGLPLYGAAAGVTGQDPITATAKTRMYKVSYELGQGKTVTEATAGAIGYDEVAADMFGAIISDPLNLAGFVGGLGRLGKLGAIGKAIGGPAEFVSSTGKAVKIPQGGLINLNGRLAVAGLKSWLEPLPLGQVPKLGTEAPEGLFKVLGGTGWGARTARANKAASTAVDYLSTIMGNRKDIGQHNILEVIADQVHHPAELGAKYATDANMPLSKVGQISGRVLELVEPARIAEFKSMTRPIVQTAEEAAKVEGSIVGQELWKRTFLGELREEAINQARKAYGVAGDAPLGDKIQGGMRQFFSGLYLTNPRYLIRNFVNGFVTTAFDGAMGFWPDAIDQLERRAGVRWHRQGFGITADLGIVPGEAAKASDNWVMRQWGRFTGLASTWEDQQRQSARWAHVKRALQPNWEATVDTLTTENPVFQQIRQANPELADNLVQSFKAAGNPRDVEAIARNLGTGKVTTIADVLEMPAAEGTFTTKIGKLEIPHGISPELKEWVNWFARENAGNPGLFEKAVDGMIAKRLGKLNGLRADHLMPALEQEALGKALGFARLHLYKEGKSWNESAALAMQAILESGSAEGARIRWKQHLLDIRRGDKAGTAEVLGTLNDFADEHSQIWKQYFETSYGKRTLPELMAEGDAAWAKEKQMYRAQAQLLGVELPNMDDFLPKEGGIVTAKFRKDALWLMHAKGSVAKQMAEKPIATNLPDDVLRLVRDFTRKSIMPEITSSIAAELKIGDEIANLALHDYGVVYDADQLLRWIAPWELWTTRSYAKWGLRMVDRPWVGSHYQQFLDNVEKTHEGKRSRRFGTQIPIPFLGRMLGDWAGDALYFDPLRVMIPLSDFAEPYGMDEQQTNQFGEVTQALEQAGLGLNPLLKVGLASSGIIQEPLGGWDYMAQQMRNLPWMSALGATTGMLTGGRAELQPLGSDAWDNYRIDRQLANMAASQEIDMPTFYQSIRQRKGVTYDTAKQRATVEKSIKRATSFFTGFGMQPSPTGEEQQYVLQGGERQARLERGRNATSVDPLQIYRNQHPELFARKTLFQSATERRLNELFDKAPTSGTARWEYFNKKSPEIGALQVQVRAEREAKPEWPTPSEAESIVGRKPPDEFYKEFRTVLGPEVERQLTDYWYKATPLPAETLAAVRKMYERMPYIARNFQEYLDSVVPRGYVDYQRRLRSEYRGGH